MKDKYYRLYCDHCGFNKIVTGDNETGLLQYKRSPIQRTIPAYDPITKKVVTKDPLELPKQWKCPGCGRLIRARNITEVITKNDANKSEGNQDGNVGSEVQNDSSSDSQKRYPEI